VAALRQQVNAVDEQILGLINRRMRLARLIGCCKNQKGAPIHDPKREQQVLERLDSLNTGPLSQDNLARIFQAIMAAARDVQGKVQA
jgi:chorismate mutase/prephenate dehydratase